MFSLHDIVEMAVQVELNGERTYRAAAAAATDPRLGTLLTWLADEEAQHARWFADLKLQAPETEASAELAEMGRSLLRGVLGDQSFSLQEGSLSQQDSVGGVLNAAIDLEADTVIFYQMLAPFLTDNETVAQLERIIEEEKRHGRVLWEAREKGEAPPSPNLSR